VSLAVVLCAGCGSRQPEAEYPSATEEVASAEESDVPPERAAPPPGSLWRDDVDATVDAGLGWFLQLVEVEPVVDAGQFRGFRVVALRPRSYWQGVDIRPGDVVTSVNGMPIERDMQAFEAFQSIKKNDELRVKYVRQGRERELVYRILPPPKDKT
jgi:type II secretory pathway component PulC